MLRCASYMKMVKNIWTRYKLLPHYHLFEFHFLINLINIWLYVSYKNVWDENIRLGKWRLAYRALYITFFITPQGKDLVDTKSSFISLLSLIFLRRSCINFYVLLATENVVKILSLIERDKNLQLKNESFRQ